MAALASTGFRLPSALGIAQAARALDCARASGYKITGERARPYLEVEIDDVPPVVESIVIQAVWNVRDRPAMPGDFKVPGQLLQGHVVRPLEENEFWVLHDGSTGTAGWSGNLGLARLRG